MATSTKKTNKQKQTILQNPFPGLRPFSIDESHLFFGREGQSDEVLLKLARNRFVGVIGPSGSGKSSFIYCGILPILYGGFLAHKGADWNVIVMRPGGGPIENLADAILRDDPNFIVSDQEEKTIRKTITSTLLRSSSLGLVEALSQNKRTKGKNYLLLVDQFEELFRFQKADLNNSHSMNEALAFVNLLTETVRQEEAPVYVAITMRSDFIGDCAQFPDLTSLINDSHYLIPQMTREQKRSAVVGPVAVGDGIIAPRLVQQLLNDLGDKSDQLPILQHALMRTWDFWAKTREGDEPMDIMHYEAIGSMSEALSQHANEAYDELNDEQKRICESIFKSLTLKRGDSDGIRRPTRVSELAAIANTNIEEVITIVEKFREPGRSLLTPPPNIALQANSVIDISHESLMRIWVRLKGWVEDEAEAVSMYMRLAEAGSMYQIGKAGLWRPPDLTLALNWQQKQKPTLVWGQRYDLAYERTMVFLEYSKQEFETEQRAKELEQKRAIRRARVTNLILGTAAVICLVMLLFAFLQMTNAKTQAELAEKATIEARKNAEKAEQQRQQADIERDNAKAQEEKALAAQQQALQSEQAAKEQAERARRSADEAERQRLAAESQKLRAEGATQEAIAANEYAQEQARIAKENEERALNLRMLSISQSIAVKSQQMRDNDNLKALLASQAYEFNKEFKGNAFNNDVYNALYAALKNFRGDSLHQMYGHQAPVQSMVVHPKGDFMYSAGADGMIIKWSTKNNALVEVIAQNEWVNKVLKVSEDGKWLLCVAENQNLQLYDLTNTKAKPRLILGATAEIIDADFLPRGNQFMSITSDNKVFHFDGNENKEISTLKSTPRSIVINENDNMVAVGLENGKIMSYSLKALNQEPSEVHQDNTGISKLRFSPNGRLLAIGNKRGDIKVWNNVTKDIVMTLPGHTARISDFTFSSDNKILVSASYDGSARIWNLTQADEQPIVLRDHPSWVFTVGIANNSEYIYTSTQAIGQNKAILRYWPLSSELLEEELCQYITKNMTQTEWDQYIGTDIEYRVTCEHINDK